MKINKRFSVMDIVAIVIILGLFTPLEYSYMRLKNGSMLISISWIKEFLSPLVNIVVTLILVCSANFLSKQLQKSTG